MIDGLVSGLGTSYNGRFRKALRARPVWYATCAQCADGSVKGVSMQRSLLAFAIAAGILAMGVTVSTGQYAAGPARSTPPRQAATKPTPSVVQKDLERSDVLSNALRARLPQGTDLNAAAAGFRRLELFVATVHASNNVDVPFYELKRRIVNDGMTLGQAIQDILPKSRYWDEARRAEDEAAAAIRTSESLALTAEKRY